MTFHLLLEDGGGLLLETGDNLLLEAGPDVMPKLILFKTEKLRPSPPDEETTPLYTAKLVDENGLPVEDGVLDAVLLQVFDEATEEMLRETESVLNTNDVTITFGATTDFEWLVQVGDTRLLDLTKTSGKTTALFEYAWDSEYTGVATDPFDTVADSTEVTVTLPSHGMTGEGNHLFFIGASDVGGVCLHGSHPVTSIVDGNTVTVTARAAATSTANGGGSISYLVNSFVLKHVVRFTVKRREPLC
jgi:hypothetical protein